MTEKQPTGTVTLLMAAAEGSARLWQTQPGDMAASLPWLRATMSHLIALNDGVLRGGEYACDSFVATFGRASDAVSCALDLQLAPSDPFSLCIGLHTIEMRTGESVATVSTDVATRLRDMAHGGETLMSVATASLATDHLPAGASLMYIGDHDLGEMPWHERPFQLRHPGVRDQFRSLRASDDTAAQHHLN